MKYNVGDVVLYVVTPNFDYTTHELSRPLYLWIYVFSHELFYDQPIAPILFVMFQIIANNEHVELKMDSKVD